MTSSSTEALLDALGPALVERAGPNLPALIEAFGGLLAAVEDVVADEDDGTPGWAILGDVDRAPDSALPWLAQWLTPPAPDLTPAQLRERIKLRPNFMKGTPDHMRGVVYEHLTGSRRIELTERFDDGVHNPATTLRLRVYAAEVIDEAKLRAAVAAIKPPLTLIFEIATGGTYAEQLTYRPTYAEQLAEWPTYADRTYWRPEA